MKNTIGIVLVIATLAAMGGLVIAADPPINIGPGGMISNGQVRHGSATYEKGANWGTITTGGSQTVIDYYKFNINNGWTISFAQPGASSAVLNRIKSGYESNIFGNLNSNGQVFIVNPAGVIFGSCSRVDVKRLVASALWMSKTDFLDMMAQDSWNGTMKFSDSYSSCGGGLVWVKPGSKLNADGVYLVGKAVVNQGDISATEGSPYVVMAAGKNVTIEEPGSTNIAVLISGNVGDSTYRAGSVTLGAGDIYSKAIIDSDLIAMTAQSDIRVSGGLASNGPIELLARDGGNDVDGSIAGDYVSMEARKNNDVDGDVSGTTGVFIKSGNNAQIDGNIQSDGGIQTFSMGDTKVDGSVDGASVLMVAGGDNKVGVDVKSDGPDGIEMTAGDDNKVVGSVAAAGGDVTMTSICCGNTVGGDVTGENVTMTAHTYNSVGGSVEAYAGDVMMLAELCYNYVKGNVTGSHVEMTAATNNYVVRNVTAGGPDSVVMTAGWNNIVDGSVEAADGDVTMTAISGRNDVTGSVTGENVTMTARTSNEVGGDVTATSGGVTMLAKWCDNDVVGNVGGDSVSMTAGDDNLVGGSVEATAGDTAMTATGGRNRVVGNVIGDNVNMTAKTSNEVGDNVDATDGDVTMLAKWCDNDVDGSVSGSNVSMTAGDDNKVGESVDAVSGDVTMTAIWGENEVGIDVTGQNVNMIAKTSNEVGGDVTAAGNVMMLAKWCHNYVAGSVNGSAVEMTAATNNHVVVNVTAGGSDGIVMTAGWNNIVDGSIEAADGDVTMTATWGKNDVADNVTGENVTMTAKTDNIAGSVTADGLVDMDAETGRNAVAGSVTGGIIDMDAATNNEVGVNVEATAGNVEMTAGVDNVVGGNIRALAGAVSVWAGQSNIVGGSVEATGGNVEMTAGMDNQVGGDVTGNNIYMTAGSNNTIGGDAAAVESEVLINSGSYTILGGNVTAETDVTIVSGTGVTLNGASDQTIEAITGKVEISTPLTEKVTQGNLVIMGGSPDLSVNLWTAVRTAGGNIEIKGLGDIQLGDYLIAGGSGELPVYHGVSVISDTGEIYTGDPGNGVNVFIQGGSDQAAGIGVGLPGDPAQKAAIVLISDAPLWLGSGAQLVAGGTYYGADGPVDDRAAVKFRNQSDWQGVPIDIAVYVQSVSGDVTLDRLGVLNVQNLGTVALDAKTRMILVNQTDAGTKGDYYLYRLEVCSRDTIWLSEAIANGTHPFVSDPALMEALMGGGTYVMRGGVNPEDIEGAWVLHEPTPPSLPTLLSQPTDEGCPAVMLAAAEEIGQDPAVFRNGIFVNTRSMQPCNTCERLIRSADVLKDADGKRLAALGQVLNEFVTTQAPPSPEQMAAINQTMAMHANDGTAYAAAQEWVDALATYVGIIKSEIGLSQADAIAIAMGKYGSPEKSDDTVKAFIAQTLAEMAG